MKKEKRKSGVCLTCRESFDTKSYRAGGGWYCSIACKSKKYAERCAIYAIGEDEKKLASTDYKAYINSAAWKRKRKTALSLASYRCQKCGLTEKETKLHVHHKTYERLGCEHMEDLQVLCADCHSKLHRRKRLRRKRVIHSL